MLSSSRTNVAALFPCIHTLIQFLEFYCLIFSVSYNKFSHSAYWESCVRCRLSKLWESRGLMLDTASIMFESDYFFLQSIITIPLPMLYRRPTYIGLNSLITTCAHATEKYNSLNINNHSWTKMSILVSNIYHELKILNVQHNALLNCYV